MKERGEVKETEKVCGCFSYRFCLCGCERETLFVREFEGECDWEFVSESV